MGLTKHLWPNKDHFKPNRMSLHVKPIQAEGSHDQAQPKAQNSFPIGLALWAQDTIWGVSDPMFEQLNPKLNKPDQWGPLHKTRAQWALKTQTNFGFLPWTDAQRELIWSSYKEWN